MRYTLKEYYIALGVWKIPNTQAYRTRKVVRIQNGRRMRLDQSKQNWTAEPRPHPRWTVHVRSAQGGAHGRCSSRIGPCDSTSNRRGVKKILPESQGSTLRLGRNSPCHIPTSGMSCHATISCHERDAGVTRFGATEARI